MPAISTKMVGQPDNLNSLYDPDVIKAMLDSPPEEVRVFLNSFITLLGSTSVDNWLYQQIVSAVLSGVADNSLTDVKLSNVAGQIKGVVAAHLVQDASLTAKGHVQLSNSTTNTSETLAATANSVKLAMDKANAASTVIVVSGVYTGDSTTKTITVGFTPKAVFINRTTSVMTFKLLSTSGAIKAATTGALTLVTNTKIVSGGFQINDADGSNYTGNSYEYAAIG